ncbi:hypothetical protein B0T16DRAFT_190850 [Cercophora newfieldiana]|uniref:REM-1 domain-containing protein n=1 Tax=Cercophora newfieldiana TaxID=92897 RepID=A0AA39Y0U6_9PEZI|nr:hypothetical protein B0T16DRAFT_190850 [Cercophora newfieldiana]
MNDEEKIQDISKKIEREKALIHAANLMRQQTGNEAVRSKLDSQMREGRRNLEFFEERLRELQLRRIGHGVDNMSLGGSTAAGSFMSSEMHGDGSMGPPAPPPKDERGGAYGDYRGYNDGYGGHGGAPGELMPAHGPFPGQPPHSAMPKARPNFSKLGTDSPWPSMGGKVCMSCLVY